MVRFQFPIESESETSIIELKFNLPQLQKVIKKWLLKHSSAVIVTGQTVVATVAGGIIGGSVQFISASLLPVVKYDGPLALLPVIFRGRPTVQARNMAVMSGALGGLSVLTNTLTGKDDVQNVVITSFSAGFVSTLAAGAKCSNAISNGLFFALVLGGIKKVQENHLRQQQPQDAFYNITKGIQSSPHDIDHNDNKTQRELITNKPPSLLAYSYLQDGKDSTGAGQINLDHSQREKDVEIGEQMNKTLCLLSSPYIDHDQNDIQKGSIINSHLPMLANSDLQELKDSIGDKLAIPDYYTFRDKEDEIGGPTNEI